MGKRLLPIALLLFHSLTARSQSPAINTTLGDLNQAIEAASRYDQEKLKHIDRLKSSFSDNKKDDLPLLFSRYAAL